MDFVKQMFRENLPPVAPTEECAVFGCCWQSSESLRFAVGPRLQQYISLLWYAVKSRITKYLAYQIKFIEDDRVLRL